MALKNTYIRPTTSIENIVAEIQKALANIGASDISYQYKDGRINGLKFLFSLNGREVGFKMPVNVDKFRLVLDRQGIQAKTGGDKEDYVYRVAWACMRDWVLAQVAFIETEMAVPAQVFLPYAYDKNGQTLYDKVMDSGFLLGDGNN